MALFIGRVSKSHLNRPTGFLIYNDERWEHDGGSEFTEGGIEQSSVGNMSQGLCRLESRYYIQVSGEFNQLADPRRHMSPSLPRSQLS